jgi:hypothetical protein
MAVFGNIVAIESGCFPFQDTRFAWVIKMVFLRLQAKNIVSVFSSHALRVVFSGSWHVLWAPIILNKNDQKQQPF